MDRGVIYSVSLQGTRMGWLMVICLSAVLVLGGVGLVRWTQEARENARRARLAALDERMKRGYRLKVRRPEESTARPKPLKPKSKRML